MPLTPTGLDYDPKVGRAWYGVPDPMPAIPGYRIIPRADSWMSCTDGLHKWLVCDTDTEWLLHRWRRINKEWQVDWTDTIRIPRTTPAHTNTHTP